MTRRPREARGGVKGVGVGPPRFPRGARVSAQPKGRKQAGVSH